jgi:hypothetical protein
MSKLMLISILLAPIIMPALAAKEKSAQVGLKRTLIRMVLFNAFYLFGLMFIYGRL